MVNKVFFTDFINTQDDVLLAIATKLNELNIEFAINPITVTTNSEDITKKLKDL